MEKCDVTIIGGGSAGLAALKQLSSLGKQSILLESGKEIGSKNVSGGRGRNIAKDTTRIRANT